MLPFPHLPVWVWTTRTMVLTAHTHPYHHANPVAQAVPSGIRDSTIIPGRVTSVRRVLSNQGPIGDLKKVNLPKPAPHKDLAG